MAAPMLRISGCVLDPRANGVYAPTAYGDLADGYVGEYWAANSGGRTAWQREYNPGNLGATADGGNPRTEEDGQCDLAGRCEFAVVFKNPDSTLANRPHWALYRHVDGEGTCLLEGPSRGVEGEGEAQVELPPTAGWRRVGEILQDGTCADLSGELINTVVIEYQQQ